ncbi:FAD-dependent oxidoreductase [Rubrimonas sp.]|uniref:FAD-dependent oxidoreductase n=1 Tax=Rubrimonas sp. TaxID=2036015 RepID=UPI002FDDAAF4
MTTGQPRDARTEAVGASLSTQVCVVGGGAAGIAATLRLAERGLTVLLVEAGATEIEGATQRLYAGRNIGLPYYDLLSCRLRYYGGTTNHWAGYCRANDPIDYEGRPELGVPAWPITAEDLAPYVAEAAATLGISESFFDPAAILTDRGAAPAGLLERRSSALETKVFQLSRELRHARLFEPRMVASPRVERVFNLNAVELAPSEDGRRIERVLARTTTGKEVSIEAETFVLCCHAIENARLLLVSRRADPRGIGNAHGHVGRHFMEHPHLFASRMIPSAAFPEIYDYDAMRRLRLNANLSLSAEAMRTHGVLNYYCRFNPVYARPGVAGALGGLRAGFMRPFDPSLIDDMARLMDDPAGASNLIGAALRRRRPAPLWFDLEHRIEQAPNPDSRIVLREERDALGVPIADLDWRLNDLDVHTFAKGQEIVTRELAALGMGRFEIETIDRDLVGSRLLGHYHHIGTTRMSHDAADGVVDRDCRVHGLDNLYVGGSSVFTTSGYSGPTMMIIAMALRMADHVAETAG